MWPLLHPARTWLALDLVVIQCHPRSLGNAIRTVKHLMIMRDRSVATVQAKGSGIDIVPLLHNLQSPYGLLVSFPCVPTISIPLANTLKNPPAGHLIYRSCNFISAICFTRRPSFGVPPLSLASSNHRPSRSRTSSYLSSRLPLLPIPFVARDFLELRPIRCYVCHWVSKIEIVLVSNPRPLRGPTGTRL